jgi:sporulation protein YlmC with PRC-barrel domain
MLNKVKIIKNYKLNCQDGEIGKVKDFYFDDQTWTIRYLIVDTGNWLSSRQVLISPHSIISMNKEEKYITVNLTKSQIESSPILESDKPVSKQFQEEFHGYYGYPMYATGMGYGGVGLVSPYVPVEKTDGEKFINKIEDENEWDPNLRSTHIVSGYGIQASDDKIGHLDDFIIDTETWEIHYLEIDTNNWLPGRKILISPNWIDHVSWNDSKVFVNLSTDEIKQSPEYTEETLLDRDFETKLHKHYNRTAYWLDKQEDKDNPIR